jgi:CheY-like chemotaxis protein
MTDRDQEYIKVIHTDDDPDDRELFKEALSRIDFKTSLQSFADCSSLVNNLLKTRDGGLPDVIFLDINMPKKNGLSCLKEIRDNKRFEKIAIVILTTSTRPEDVQEANKLGANLFLNKPSNFKELKSLLSHLLKPSGLQFLGTAQKGS